MASEHRAVIYTVAFNRPDFLRPQLESLRTFIAEPFEMVVLNNGEDDHAKLALSGRCFELGIHCIGVEENNRDTANESHGSALTWSFQHVISAQTMGYACIMDCDMFMVKPFSFAEHLDGYDMGASAQLRGNITYPWPGLMMFDMETIQSREEMDFMCAVLDEGTEKEEHLDVGGMLHQWIEKYEPRWRRFSSTGSISAVSHPELIPPELLLRYQPDFKFEFHEKAFLHYHAGSNWDRQTHEHHTTKTDFLLDWLRSVGVSA